MLLHHTQNVLILDRSDKVTECIRDNKSSYPSLRSVADIVSWRPFTPHDSAGIYFGKVVDISNLIKSHLNPNPISSFKSVYFDKLCQYPRYKLSENTSIKRKINPEKADSIIISHRGYMTHNYLSTQLLKNGELAVLYDSTSDTYYIIPGAITDRLIPSYYSAKAHQSLCDFLTIRNYTSASIANTIVLLTREGFLPTVQKVYEGPYILLSENEYSHFKIITNPNMLLTYDTDLDQFVSQSGQAMTEDDLKTIDSMLSSSDSSTVAMGMKLLANYNIFNAACAVTTLIAKNIHHIRSNSAKTSAGFKSILTSLNITLYENEFDMINKAYKYASDETDKQYGKQIILNYMQSELDEVAKRLKNRFENIDIAYDIKLS